LGRKETSGDEREKGKTDHTVLQRKENAAVVAECKTRVSGSGATVEQRKGTRWEV